MNGKFRQRLVERTREIETSMFRTCWVKGRKWNYRKRLDNSTWRVQTKDEMQQGLLRGAWWKCVKYTEGFRVKRKLWTVRIYFVADPLTEAKWKKHGSCGWFDGVSTVLWVFRWFGSCDSDVLFNIWKKWWTISKNLYVLVKLNYLVYIQVTTEFNEKRKNTVLSRFYKA